MTGTNTPIVRVRSLHIAYDGQDILKGVDMDIAANQVMALVGASGAGKSTLGLCLAGMLPDYRGEVTVDGWSPKKLDHAQLQQYRGQKTGLVSQDPRQFFDPMFTLGFQVVESMISHFPMPRKHAADKARQLLHKMGLPDPGRIMDAYPHEVSGGMLVRAALALVLGLEPALVIADEVTAALDPVIGVRVLDLLKQTVPGPDRALLLITHDLTAAARISDRIAVLENGVITKTGSINEILGKPAGGVNP